MFIGHFGIALGARKIAPNLSLGTLFIAAQCLDLIWPVLLLVGVESVNVEPMATVVTPLNFEYYPISHRLLMAGVWSVLLVLIYRGLVNRTFWVLCPIVLSHWVLDWITHRPDLPLVPGSDFKVGLGLWNWLTGTLLVEAIIFFLGLWIYTYCTTSRDRAGKYGLAGLVLFLIVAYLNNIFGPPPPNDPMIIGLVTLSMWLLVLWAYWVDRHRRFRN